jgi:hypothetical protein
MSSDHEAEIRASVGAHYDLGPHYDDAVAEGLVERIGVEIDKRIDARLELVERAGSPSGPPVAPGVTGPPAGSVAPPGATVPFWPGAPPGAVVPPVAPVPPAPPVPPVGLVPPVAPAPPVGLVPPVAPVPPGPPAPYGYQGYQAPPGYPSAGYQGYPGYQVSAPPPGYYQAPAPGAAPPSVSHAHRSVAFTVTALGSMTLGVIATAVVSRAPTAPGAQAIMVLLIWTAIAVINIVWARRR